MDNNLCMCLLSIYYPILSDGKPTHQIRQMTRTLRPWTPHSVALAPGCHLVNPGNYKYKEHAQGKIER